MLFTGTLDAILELAPIVRELLSHFVRPAGHIAAYDWPEAYDLTDVEFMCGHRALHAWPSTVPPRSGRSARLSPKVLAISAHTIFKLEQTAGAALNDALLRQIVDNLRRHPKTARQSVG